MAYKITEECTNCGACESECKNEAIKKGETIYLIDPERCTECIGWYESPKCAELCVLSACVPDPAHKENRAQLLAKWKRLHSGKTPQVT